MPPARSHAALLDRFPGTKVLVVGDVMLDEYVWGDASRISPEAPVPVVEIERRTYLPGGAANAAVGVASLGGEPVLAGVVGRDREADELRRALADRGVESRLAVDGGRPTTTKTRIMAHNQQLVRADLERRAPVPSEVEDELLPWIEESARTVDALIVSDYAKGLVSARLAARCIGAAREAGKPVVVDPKGVDYARYRGATVVTPNVQEAERAASQEGAGDLTEIARGLMSVLEGSALLVTRGGAGMSLFSGGATPVDIPAAARNVFDVTGAGDTVVTTLAMALAHGTPLEEAAELATEAAGIAVDKVGTTAVTLEELRARCSDGEPR